MDRRSQQLLKVLISQHIADGAPVGSKTLSSHSEVDLSPASIRNIMKTLEDQGFISSPHTSAGRIPTKKVTGTLWILYSPSKSQLFKR